ncbi:MAG TPA: glycosyltransferase family 2 protein [Chloroflexi bacterium]|nr:glycosyltransferase family 2 protein [Chloroflexota bacterium]
MNKQEIAIIIVTHNSWDHLSNCLKSLEKATQNISSTVFIIDNASTDDTISHLTSEHKWCTLITNKDNGGYSKGNNIGLKEAGFPKSPIFRYALLLNPDTILPPTSLNQLLHYMNNNPEIGVLGPKLVLANGKLDKACKRGLPTPATSFYHMSGLAKLFPKHPTLGRYNMSYIDEDSIADVDSTVGACQLIRGEALEKSGLLDEMFFMYGEDIDLNVRIKQSGYRIVYYPLVTIKHLKGTSTRKEPDLMIKSFYNAMKLFHKKHFSDNYPHIINQIIYLSINLLCYYKRVTNQLKPSHKRIVGSAPK